MFTASSAQRPACSARPAREWPSGPGNISGNRVRTEARQVIGAHSAHPAASTSEQAAPHPHLREAEVTTTPARRHIHHRHRRARERHHQRRRALPRDLQARPGAVIMHRRHGPDRRTGGIHRRQPDQVGQIELVLLRRRQAVAVDVEPRVGQPRGRVAVGDLAPPPRRRSPPTPRPPRRASAARNAARIRRSAARSRRSPPAGRHSC